MASPTVVRISEDFLRKRLKALREGSGVTVAALAKKMRCSKSWVSKIENGNLRLSDEYVKKFADALKLKEFERNSLFELDSWNYARSDALKQVAERLRPYQEAAKQMLIYDPVYLAYCLQTEQYTERILSGVKLRKPSAEDYGDALRIRAKLKNEIVGKEITAIVTESSLYGPFAPRDIMPAQIEHLIQVCREETVGVAILPLAAPVATNVLYDINIYDDELLVSETFFGPAYSSNPVELDRARRIFESLYSMSVMGRKRFEILKKALRFHET